MEWLKGNVTKHPKETESIDMAIGLSLKIKKSELESVKNRFIGITTNSDKNFLRLQGFTEESGFYVHEKCDNIYLDVYQILNFYNEESYIMALFHGLGIKNQYNEWLQWYLDAKSIFLDIKTKEVTLMRTNDSIRNRLVSLNHYEPFDASKIMKEAKKIKIKSELLDNGNLYFDLGKIKCGDDNEGYINYQNIGITLKANHTLALIDVHYKFAKWEYKYSWGHFAWNMHPHINGAHLCAGNRLEDFNQYLVHREYGFLLSAYREALTSYNPASAYIKVTEIAKLLNGLNHYYDITELKSEDSDEIRSRKLYDAMYSRRKRCSKCGNTYYGAECDTQDCVKNPKTNKSCSCCDEKMEWNSNLHIIKCPTCYVCESCGRISVEQHCMNKNCSRSPLYSVPCTKCFGKLHAEGHRWYCDNPQCTSHKDYSAEGLSPIPKPVCMICNQSHYMNQNLHYEWYCTFHGHLHSDSQYTQYGAPLMNEETFEARARQLARRIIDNNLKCPYCASALNVSFDEENLTYSCSVHGELFSMIEKETEDGQRIFQLNWRQNNEQQNRS